MRYSLLLFVFSFASQMTAQSAFLEQLLKENEQHFQTILEEPEQFDVQIIYTEIDRDENNRPHFNSHTYQLNETDYFYPASTVKMPVAILALEKCNQLNIIGLDKYSKLEIDAASAPQTSVLSDSTSANKQATIAHYIRKIFTVSDNDAYNRLYEFLGQEALNEALQAKGFDHTRILHRLSAPSYDLEANRHTNPISFYHDSTLLYHQGEVYSQAICNFELQSEVRGVAYQKGDEIINEPFDFRQKNYISLQDLHDMLKVVLFPESVSEKQRFDLTSDDYEFLYRNMSMLPRESDFPQYEEPDNYGKFFIYGDQENVKIPDHIRIFNKVGWAYGYLTDVSYIVDYQANIEFMLAATIHVNANQIYNDGVYEYEEIGLPFFGNLGRLIYAHELQRKRAHTPNLSRFSLQKD